MHTITRLSNKNHFTMCCDFCAVSEGADGVRLIASPNGTHICQNCVTMSAAIIAEKGWDLHYALVEKTENSKEPKT
tara:strand:+ start:407 stop:634 length:228 start_codon:yes stop_codon:yes gene_type:complete